MAEISKFFNSAPGDPRKHFASDFADYFRKVLSAGLLLDENEEYGLQVTLDSGLKTVVSVGAALIKGYSYENTTPLTLTHSLPETEFDRIDRVVLRLDLRNQNRYIRAFVKEGVAATNPVPPELQRDEYVYELSLAQVILRANTASIDANDITDERALEDVCGIVQSLVTVPTSVFQQQFDAWFNSRKDYYESIMADWQAQEQADFDAWFQSIKNILDGDVAANLAARISIVEQDVNAHLVDYVKHPGYATTTGPTNTYAVTLNPAPTAYVDGMGIVAKINAASTGASTLNVNGLGAKPIKDPLGNDITSGGLKVDTPYALRYEATSGNFIVLGKGGGGNLEPNQALAGFTFTNDNGPQVGLGDANLIASNILSGKSIFGVTGNVGIVASDIVLFSDGNYNTVSTTPVKRGKRFTSKISGSVRIKMAIASNEGGTTALGQVYKNGEPVGTVQSSTTTSGGTTFTQDFICDVNDYFDVYIWRGTTSVAILTSISYCADPLYTLT